MYQFDMTDDEVKEAKWAAREVGKHLDGIKLDEGLRIGAVLMKGRQHAMAAAGSPNKPQGKAYAEAFREWKQAFKFREGREAEDYYAVAIVCAQHRTIADEIVAGLRPKQRSEMGVFGLAKRVRAKLKELEEGPQPPKAKAAPKGRQAEIDGRFAELEERLAAAEPKSTSDLVALLARREPVEVLEHLRLHQHAWFERLMAAARNAAEWRAAEPAPKAPRGRKPKVRSEPEEEAGGYAPGVLEAIGARIKASLPKS
jgi:hypothetical protein